VNGGRSDLRPARSAGSKEKSALIPELGRLYPILDARAGLESRALELCDAVLRAGAPWLQLRCKQAGGALQLRLAQDVVARAARHGARVIVNDRVDVALCSGAAGAHLGQDDLPLAAARRLAPNLVLGISTHSVAQARAAAAAGADYIGFGPMFATTSKADALSPRAEGELRAVRDAVRIPIVAIGGIAEETATSILDAGADAVAMIGALATSDDPEALARRLLRG
jgi:thiamine-phosphate diphosphorylase